MKRTSQAAVAVSVAAVVALVVRLRGRGGTPPRDGGWRELTEDELTAT
ncbi:MAG TPA: hypothetical protein VGA13_13855 [Acidimicrobiales bacterium]|jgi:hypothetical protein